MPQSAARQIIRNCGLWALMTGAFCRSRSLPPGSTTLTESLMRSAWGAKERRKPRERRAEALSLFLAVLSSRLHNVLAAHQLATYPEPSHASAGGSSRFRGTAVGPYDLQPDSRRAAL